MTSTPLMLSAAAFIVVSAVSAAAAPAYVASTVNLRSGPGTGYEIVTKIPGSALVDANNCINGWCEVIWQGKTGFAIATALDTSGRVPGRAAAVRRAPVSAPGAYLDDEVGVADPPVYVGGPVYYGYYPYRYRPYGYYGYRGHWGYRGYRRRW